MTHPTHVLIAASGGLAAGLAMDAAPAVTVIAALAANEIPDKDRHAQKGQKRGATHWLITGVLLALAVSLLGRAAGVGFLTGYTLHLLADAMTPEGVPLLGPLTSHRFRLLPFRLRVVSGRPPDGWVRCPYTPIPEFFAGAVVVAADVVFLLPALTGG